MKKRTVLVFFIEKIEIKIDLSIIIPFLSMSSEFDLSTDLAAIQARLNGAFDGIYKILAPSQCAMPATDMEQQLKEQTRQMKEMADMMKSMMSQAMPLLEEKASKLHKEKEEESRKQVENALRKEERVRKCKEEQEKKEQMRWHREGASCSRPHCGYRIAPGSGYLEDEVTCQKGHVFSISKQRPANDTEKSYIETFLRDHEYQKEHQRIGDKARWDTTLYMWIWKDIHFIRVLRQVAPVKQTKPDSNPMWICPNDGMVHYWTYNSKKYFRNYDDEIWINKNDELGEWVGKWNPLTKTIDTTAPEPEFEDE